MLQCMLCSTINGKPNGKMDLEFQVISGSVVEQLVGSVFEVFVDDPSDSWEKTGGPNQDEDEDDDAWEFFEWDFGQNDDWNATVDAPADNLPKPENLHQIVQKMSKVFHFIHACRKAVNTDLDIEIPGGLGIRFNIPEPIDTESFCGREDFLTQLHDNLKIGLQSEVKGQRSKSKLLKKLAFPILSKNELKIVAVCGPGGIGKTETVLKYITQYGRFYNNIIWIEAETENSMRNSFVNLADVNELEIPVENSSSEGKHREIKEIVKEIYNKICEGGQSNLIVFDNAGDYQSWSKFFPLEIPPDLKKPLILVTSRNPNPEGISNAGAGKIQFQVLPLDVLTENERLEYIRKQLEIEIPDSDRKLILESKEFIQTIGGLPLALQQAVACIKQKKKLRKILGKSYQISDYVHEFKLSMEKFGEFGFPPENPEPEFSGTSAVYVTWVVTLLKLLDLDGGENAIKILEILSFLYADKIPSSFLRDLVPEIGDVKFSGALKLLEKYSLIKMHDNKKDKKDGDKDFSINIKIHRQLQLVILQYLKTCEDARRINVLMNIVEKCNGILENLHVENCKNVDIFLNMHQIVESPFNNLNPMPMRMPMAEEFLDFVDEFGWVLWESRRYSESLQVWQKVHGKFNELLGKNHHKTLDSEHQIALNLEKLGREDEALRLFKENLVKKEIHPDFGPDHFDTIEIKYNIASILRHQGKNQASLFWFQQVLAHRIKNQEENDPETLALQDQMGQIHTELGNFSKALALYTDVEKKQKEKQSEAEILSPDSDADHQQNYIITKQNKAAVLYAMGKFREAAKTFKEIHAKQRDVLGEKHLQTVNTLVWIAKSLEQTGPGNLEQALDLYNKVYEIRKRNSGFGEDHPQTIHTKYNIAKVLRQQKRFEDSLRLFQQVLLQQNKILGEKHPETFKTQNSIAQLHSEQGDFSKALEMLEQFEKERVEILGSHDELVLVTKQQRAVVLYQMDQFQEAAKVFHEVYEARKETLGENHRETIKTSEWIKGTEEKIRILTQALDTWWEVYEISKSRQTSFDEDSGSFLNVPNPKPQSKSKLNVHLIES